MFIAIVIMTLTTYYTSIFFNLGLFENYELFIESLESLIRNNMHVFGVSPLHSVSYLIDPDVVFRGGSVMASPVEFNHVYWHFWAHPAWSLNEALDRLLIISQFNMVIAGIVIATAVYRNADALGDSAFAVIRKQVIVTIYFSLMLIVVVSIVGVLTWNLAIINASTNHANQIYLLQSLHNIEGMWIPDATYYIGAIIGVFIQLFSIGILGVLVGHVLKDFVIAFVTVFFIFTYYFTFLISYVISPFYFLARITPYLIVRGVALGGAEGEFLLSIGMLIVYLLVVLLLSTLIIKLRLFRDFETRAND